MSETPAPLPELKRVLYGDILEPDAAEHLMTTIMDGKATPAQIGALLGAYKLRQPTVEELAGFARAMRAACRQIAGAPERLFDTAGTGGATVKSFNISTTAGFIIAGAGLPVAKHGNRSVTSPSGSADVLEALGAKLETSPEVVVRLLKAGGFAFLFAPSYHPAMKHAIGPRRELGVPTVFNILGPLTNPAKPSHQLIGVGHPALVRVMAETMSLVGIQGAVVHGAPGFDEVSITGPTTVAYVQDGEVETGHLTPKDLGVKSADVPDVAGVPPAQAKDLLVSILDGEQGPRTEMVLATTGLALYTAGEAEDPADGVELARQVLQEGRARKALDTYITGTNEA